VHDLRHEDASRRQLLRLRGLRVHQRLQLIGEGRRDVLRFLAECLGGLTGMSPRLAVTFLAKLGTVRDLGK